MAAEGDGHGEGAGQGWSRRRFLAGSGLAAGGIALGLGACSDDSSSDDAKAGAGSGGTPSGGASSTTPSGPSAVDPKSGIADADVPTEAVIFGWIHEVFSHGVRRPGYPANRWAETWILEQFESIGLADVRREPVDAVKWTPTTWSVEVTSASGTKALTGFPVPFAKPTGPIDLELAAFSKDEPAAVKGKVALVDVPLITIPAAFLATAGSAPDDPTGRVFDPVGTFDGGTHTVPFGTDFQAVMDPAIDAGAAAFFGTLTDYPGNSHEYFVPYDGIDRPIPGIWLSGTDGAWLRDELAAGPVHVHLQVATETEPITTYNIIGELPGADDEPVMIGSHHDGPWSSAVEDASGISMVLAQATYWAAQPRERRPHRMVFLLQGGHMSGGAGLVAYVGRHRDELDHVVLEMHLEHVSLEAEERDGKVVPTDRSTPRWFFTSRNPSLEAQVGDAIQAEELWRSLILAPDAFGAQPPTDGALYHSAGVPIVQHLAAPFYLFDKMDTLDKIDRRHLVPLTRTTIRILNSTKGISAAQMRAGVV